MQNIEFYRHFLQEELAKRCEQNPRYSLRSFAKALGINDGALSQVISGKRVPSIKTAQKLIEKLNLTPLQVEYFMKSLGEAQRSRSMKRLSPSFRQMAETSTVRDLSLDMFRIIADWYHLAIVELTFTKDFQPTSHWIAKQLKITPTEAKLAIDRLLKLELLEKANGTLKKASQRISTADKHLTTPAHRQYQKQIIQKSLGSLENDPIEVRNHTGMTMCIDPRKIPHAKKMIQEFQKQLCEFLESGSRTQVYQLVLSMFPLQIKEK